LDYYAALDAFQAWKAARISPLVRRAPLSDERRLAHDQGPLGIFLLSHTHLVESKAGRPPARAEYGAMLWKMDA
jgi:hypothetical protein